MYTTVYMVVQHKEYINTDLRKYMSLNIMTA